MRKQSESSRSEINGEPLPETTGTSIAVCPLAELPHGARRLVEHEGMKIGVFNCDGALYAIEDRCSHDNGPLAAGELDASACTVECPREIRITDIMYALKQRAMAERIYPSYPPRFGIPVLARQFFLMVLRYGRVTETQLVLRMFLRANWRAGLASWRMGLGLIRTGRWQIRQHRIKGQRELAAMLAHTRRDARKARS